MIVRRGMTLMELVVALVITGLMAVMGASTLASIIDHRRVILGSTSELERASALRDQIRSWMLAGSVLIVTRGANRGMAQTGAVALPPPPEISSGSGPGSSASAITSAIAGGDEIAFITTAANPANAPSVRMRLFIDADPNTPETGLTLEYQPSTATPIQRIQLEPSVGVLHVDFLDQRTNRWVESTQAAATSPIAVRLSMEAYDGRTVPGILQLPMVFPMGSLLAGR